MNGRNRIRSSTVVLAAYLAAGCAGTTATHRLQRHFGLQEVESEAAIRGQLEEKFPMGTPEEALAAFLDASQLGRDGRSVVAREEPTGDPRSPGGRTLCRVLLDPGTSGWVKEEYAVAFLWDERRRLRGIEVRRTLKGL